jgi:hypothetical protein
MCLNYHSTIERDFDRFAVKLPKQMSNFTIEKQKGERRGSNPRMEAPQASALPLGDYRHKLMCPPHHNTIIQIVMSLE